MGAAAAVNEGESKGVPESVRSGRSAMVDGMATHAGVLEAPVPALKMNDAMAKFVATMPIPVSSDFLEDTQPIRLCPKTGFNETDGETYRCCLAAGHKFNCKPGERV